MLVGLRVGELKKKQNKGIKKEVGEKKRKDVLTSFVSM